MTKLGMPWQWKNPNNEAGFKQRYRSPNGEIDATIYATVEQGLDWEERWTIICNKHGSVIGTNTLNDARLLARYPDEFCEYCGGLLYDFDDLDVVLSSKENNVAVRKAHVSDMNQKLSHCGECPGDVTAKSSYCCNECHSLGQGLGDGITSCMQCARQLNVYSFRRQRTLGSSKFVFDWSIGGGPNQLATLQLSNGDSAEVIFEEDVVGHEAGIWYGPDSRDGEDPDIVRTGFSSLEAAIDWIENILTRRQARKKTAGQKGIIVDGDSYDEGYVYVEWDDDPEEEKVLMSHLEYLDGSPVTEDSYLDRDDETVQMKYASKRTAATEAVCPKCDSDSTKADNESGSREGYHTCIDCGYNWKPKIASKKKKSHLDSEGPAPFMVDGETITAEEIDETVGGLAALVDKLKWQTGNYAGKKKTSGTWPLSEQDQDDFDFYEEIASEDYGYNSTMREDYTEEAIEAAERAAEKLGLDWPPTRDSARGYQNNYGKYSKKTAAGSDDWYDTNFDDEDSYAPGDVVRTCARCRGLGEIRGIYGEEPCPLCFGEGVMRLGKKKVAAFGVQYIKWTRGTPGETKVKDFPTKEARDKWIAKQEEEGDIEVLSYADSGSGMLASKKTAESSPLSGQLKILLSDAMSLYFKAHAAHWNVTGSDFSQFHEMFAEIYEDVYDSIDPIAENIRALDDFAPQDIADLEEMRQITPLSVTSDVPTLVADLLANNEAYLVTLNESFAMANEMNQQGIADFIAGRILTHQKWSWQLKSSLPSPSIAEARRRFR